MPKKIALRLLPRLNHVQRLVGQEIAAVPSQRDPRLRLLNRIAAICGNFYSTPFYTILQTARYGQPEAEPVSGS